MVCVKIDIFFDRFWMERLEEKVRQWISNRIAKPNDETPPEERTLRDYTPVYLHFHHVGFYFVILARTAFSDSFLSDSPLFFYYALVVFCLSLDLFTYTNRTSPGWVTAEPANSEGLYYCEVCKFHCPLRAAHCRTCGRCVLRRDHHCPWTGNCIGRDNHLYFYLWLWCELLVMVPFFLSVVKYLLVPKPPLTWLVDNAGTLVVFFFCGFDSMMAIWLILGHTLMMTENVTQWEMSRRERISYLKDLPLGMNPFDRGIWENIKEFVTMGFTHKEWADVSFETPNIAQFQYEREYVARELGVENDDLVTPIRMSTKFLDPA